MSLYGKLEEFGTEKEDWTQYVEQLTPFFFLLRTISRRKKKQYYFCPSTRHKNVTEDGLGNLHFHRDLFLFF